MEEGSRDRRGKAGMVGNPTSHSQGAEGMAGGQEEQRTAAHSDLQHCLVGAGAEAAARSPGTLIGAEREHTRSRVAATREERAESSNTADTVLAARDEK